jgi:polygalacturonase
MNRLPLILLAGLACLTATTRPLLADPMLPVQSAPNDDIVAALPVIPAATFNLTDFGGVGDKKTFNTEAFKKAIAAIAQAGGGHLIVPAGTYKTLPFFLTSRMDLHLEPGAIIRAPEKFTDYGWPDPNSPEGTRLFAHDESGGGPHLKPLISGANLTDVSITGSGTIDGSGAMFWLWSDKTGRRFPKGRNVVNRPFLVVFTGVQRLLVDGVTLTNSPMFHLVPSGQDITIQNLRILAPSDAPNTDAMDPAGKRIVIRNCEIDTGDDNVALHSGSRDVLIENLTCLHGHGISIGSPTELGLSHVIVRHCTFDGTDNGLRIKSYRGRGGEVHDIWYSDLTMRFVARPFDINMVYNGNAGLPIGDLGPREAEPGQTKNIPNFHDIHVSNLTITRSPIAGRIVGIPEQMANAITFTNVNIQSDRGFFVRDAKDVSFTNVEIHPAVGPPIITDHATVNWNGTIVSGTTGGSPVPFY